jgi:hypothetical protein
MLALLNVLAQLTQLQHLRATDMWFDQMAAPQHLSALTRSPQLTSLAVVVEDEDGLPLPANGVQHMLPKGQQLTQLRVLELQGLGCSVEQCLNSDDIQRIQRPVQGSQS